MVPCAHPASTKPAFLFVAENLATGNLELRDNAGGVTGYIIRDDVIGGYDPRDADGRKRGVLIAIDAIGGLRFEPSLIGKALEFAARPRRREPAGDLCHRWRRDAGRPVKSAITTGLQEPPSKRGSPELQRDRGAAPPRPTSDGASSSVATGKGKKAELASLETLAFGQSTTRLVSHGPITPRTVRNLWVIYS